MIGLTRQQSCARRSAGGHDVEHHDGCVCDHGVKMRGICLDVNAVSRSDHFRSGKIRAESGLALQGNHATIDNQFSANGKTCLIGCQENNGLGNFCNMAKSSERDLRDN